MWTYKITTGTLSRDGTLVGRGYSGAPDCKNDPTKCGIKNHGPIPPGRYAIGAPRHTASHGPFVLPLVPDPANEMHGRTSFLIHGDSVARPGTASQGCIIMDRRVREAVHASGDIELEVTEGEEECSPK